MGKRIGKSTADDSHGCFLQQLATTDDVTKYRSIPVFLRWYNIVGNFLIPCIPSGRQTGLTWNVAMRSQLSAQKQQQQQCKSRTRWQMSPWDRNKTGQERDSVTAWGWTCTSTPGPARHGIPQSHSSMSRQNCDLRRRSKDHNDIVVII